MKEYKSTIIYTLIGLAVVLVVYLLVAVAADYGDKKRAEECSEFSRVTGLPSQVAPLSGNCYIQLSGKWLPLAYAKSKYYFGDYK